MNAKVLVAVAVLAVLGAIQPANATNFTIAVNGPTNQTNSTETDLGHYFNASYITALTANITSASSRNISISRCGVNTTGLVLCTLFDENSGMYVNDSSKNNINGTWKGNNTANWTTGKYNSGGNLSAANLSYVQIPHSASLNLSNYTVSIFFRKISDVTAGKQYTTLVNKNANSSAYSCQNPFDITVSNSTGTLYAQVGNGNTTGSDCTVNLYGYLSLTGSKNVSDGLLHQGVLTYNNISKRYVLYADGVNETSKVKESNWSLPNNSYNLTVGLWAPYLNYGNMAVDELQIYNRTLDDVEVRQNFLIQTQQLAISNKANGTVKYYNSTADNPVPIPYSKNEAVKNISYSISQYSDGGVTVYEGYNNTLFTSIVSYNTMLVGTTSSIDNVSVYNSTIGIVSQDTGSKTFQLQSDYFGNLRVTDNSQTVLSYNNGTFYKVSGWNASYDGTNITLDANLTALSGQRNYVVVDFAPQAETISSGYYGRTGNQASPTGSGNSTQVDLFNNFSFDWYWYQSYDKSHASSADIVALDNGRKKVLFRTWFWDNNTLSGKNWTQLDTNTTLLNVTIDSIRRQVDAVGADNIYAIVISEEEPDVGFSGAINQTSYVNASSSIYTSLKSLYPTSKVLQGTHILSLSSANLSLLLRDGTVDDWYNPLYTGANNLSMWYDNISTEQSTNPDTYALIWAGSNYSGYVGLTPQYTQDAFELGRSKGIHNVGFFGQDNILSRPILFYDYNYNPALNLSNRSELYKESMFRMSSVYSAAEIYGVYKGFQNTIDAGGNITYSRVIYSSDVRLSNFSAVSSISVDIFVTTYNTSGDFRKTFNSSCTGSAAYTVGDNPQGRRMFVKRDGSLYTTLQTNATGYISFSSTCSDHTFDIVIADPLTRITLTAVSAGTVGNSITTTETLGNASWGAATLTGGSDGSQWNSTTNTNIVTGPSLWGSSGGILQAATIIGIAALILLALFIRGGRRGIGI